MSPVMESQRTIIFLYVVIRLSDTEEVKKNLTGTVGGNITLPDPVMERGVLLYRGKPVARVYEMELNIRDDIYMNRVHWNKTTGLFTLSGLKKNDSGDYYIESETGRAFTTSYKVSVFDSVPSPAVKTLSVSSSFRCVATSYREDNPDQRHCLISIIIFVIVAGVVALTPCFIIFKYLHPKKTISQTQVMDQESDMEYTEVSERNQRENFPDSSENGQQSMIN